MGNFDQYIDLCTTPVVATWDAYSATSSSGGLQGRQYTRLSAAENSQHSCKCQIITPHMAKALDAHRQRDERPHVRELSARHHDTNSAFREIRKTHYAAEHLISYHWPHPRTPDPTPQTGGAPSTSPSPMQKLKRSVYDARHTERLPGHLSVSMTGASGLPGYKQKGTSQDPAVNAASANALDVFSFYLNNYKHNSIDGRGMPIVTSVHYGQNYENAFWDGTEMVCGDGSEFFESFVEFLDVIGHEMSHGVTGNRLQYEGEAGALNEHFSDVMGYLAYMYKNKLSADQANWLLADGILKWNGKTFPLRSFAAPGTAYDIPELGKDPQPAKYGDLYKGTEDNGGVHINSGIPNHAFYLFAKALGGNPWEKAGLIWFTTMMTVGAFKPTASMKDFATATLTTAGKLFPGDNTIDQALRKAWKTVEVIL